MANKKNNSVKSSNSVSPILLISFIVLIIVIVGLLFYSKKLTSKISPLNLNPAKPTIAATETPRPTATPTPKPTPYPLHGGSADYQFSHGPKLVGPLLKEVVIDPLDPAVGANQTFTVTATNPTPITSVKLTLNLDKTSRVYTLTQKSGTPTDGTWQVSLKVDDTHLYKYYPYFELTASNGTYKGGITIR